MKSYAVAITSLFSGACEIKFVKAESFTEALCVSGDYAWVRDFELDMVEFGSGFHNLTELERLKYALHNVDEFLDIKEIPDLIE